MTQTLDGDDEIDVLLPTRSAGYLSGVRVHRTRHLSDKDVRWCNNIPVTSPARTLLDLGAVFDELELEAALLTALGRNLVARIATMIANLRRPPDIPY